MYWLETNWQLALGLALAAVGLWWIMPRRAQTVPVVGVPLLIAGLCLLGWVNGFAIGPLSETAMFGFFATAAIVCAILMISSRNPVYSALWFALATLCVCGLFLLQSAQFLAAATIIIYAGAIVVTFVFVIMLAQQEGTAVYDHFSRQPLVAIAVGFFILGSILTTIHDGPTVSDATSAAASTNLLSSVEADQPLGTLTQLGRSLFGDYLFSVEIAGTLLLVATIGAISMAPRRARGTL
jgi:NADH-quinone oxidoreductase subunit J